MMKPKELFDAGRVTDAINLLASWLRDHPTDVAQRTFLFELLCFAGQYDRAEKQLSVLSQGGPDTQLGATIYYAALHAERARNELFRDRTFPSSEVSDEIAGTLNGKSFLSFRDADPSIGARLEVYAAGAYLWIALHHIASLQMAPPKRLRDTLWAGASVLTGPSFKGMELGQVMVPAIYPFSWEDPSESVWLGRSTVWNADGNGSERPRGQKLFLVDGEEFPVLEVRSLEFLQPEPVATV